MPVTSINNENIDGANSLYLHFNYVGGYFECNSTECNSTEESNENKYLIFASTDTTKKYWKSTKSFGIKLKIKLEQ